MNENYYLIALKDTDIEPMIKALASEDMRSIGNETAWLIRKEYFARHPKTLAELNSHASQYRGGGADTQETASNLQENCKE
jgi:hypothetical protein